MIARSSPKISVAIALLNEARGLEELLRRVGAVLDELPGGPHEIVMVDDGSSDGTWKLLEEASARDPRIFALCLSRNFGHQAALSAALDRVTGDVVIVMDGDLQDPPEAIPFLLAAWQEGADVVYGLRRRRREGLFLRACYHVFYRLIGRLADVELPVDAGDFGLISRRVVEVLRRMPERHRYLRGMRTWVGFKQVGIPVERGSRFAGQSSYSARRLLRLALDGIFSFSVIPLRLASSVGALAIGVSVSYAAWAVAVKVAGGVTPPGFTSLILALVFLSGVQLLSLGILGEYVGRIFQESKRRPHYVVAATARGGRVEERFDIRES